MRKWIWAATAAAACLLGASSANAEYVIIRVVLNKSAMTPPALAAGSSAGRVFLACHLRECPAGLAGIWPRRRKRVCALGAFGGGGPGAGAWEAFEAAALQALGWAAVLRPGGMTGIRGGPQAAARGSLRPPQAAAPRSLGHPQAAAPEAVWPPQAARRQSRSAG